MTRYCSMCILMGFILGVSGLSMAEQPATDFSIEQSREAIGSLAQWVKSSGDSDACEVQAFANVPLSKEDAVEAASILWKVHVDHVKDSLAREWTEKCVQAADQSMKFDYRVFGEKPEGGWSLYISLHGGGNAASQVNDRQWQNQIKLYKLNEGIYVAPRAPTNTWNLWHEAHIDALLERLIEGAAIVKGVNVNRVYIMGYSAGGDGVFQLAPRMADRWAAAAMMAGHPNEASPLGLRNIGFTLHMGGEDAAYHRNEVATQWQVKLDALRDQDPGGYAHVVDIHKGLGHWMNGEDAVAIPWMEKFTRTPWPDRVVWFQDDVTHSSFYWLAVSQENRKTGTLVEVERHGQEFIITKTTGLNELTLLLNDSMLDLDKPMAVHYNGKCLFEGMVSRRIQVIAQSLEARHDPELMFSAEVTVKLNPVE